MMCFEFNPNETPVLNFTILPQVALECVCLCVCVCVLICVSVCLFMYMSICVQMFLYFNKYWCTKSFIWNVNQKTIRETRRIAQTSVIQCMTGHNAIKSIRNIMSTRRVMECARQGRRCNDLINKLIMLFNISTTRAPLTL